jgi:hypothetical protein
MSLQPYYPKLDIVEYVEMLYNITWCYSYVGFRLQENIRIYGFNGKNFRKIAIFCSADSLNNKQALTVAV